MNDNTILRIKVPAHLYESVKQQLTLNEAKAKHNYGAGMEVVKEKKMKVPKDGMKKMEEEKNEEVKEAVDNKKERSLDELKAAKEKLEKKIHEMEGAHKVEEYVGMSPDQQELVNILGQLIASGAAGAAVISAAKQLLAKIKGGKKEMPNEAKEEVEEAKEEDVKKNLKEYEVIYVVRDGKCYRKDDEGNMDEVDMRKCR